MKYKNIILILGLLFLSIFSFAQSFGEVGTKWYYDGDFNWENESFLSYTLLESTKDTIINDITVHKIEHTTFYAFSSVKKKPIYLYEQQDTVYRYSFLDSTFKRLYIFNVAVGDTLTLHGPGEYDYFSGEENETAYRSIVTSIDTSYIDGELIKQYSLQPLDLFQFWSKYTDRIGGLAWMFPRIGIIPEDRTKLRCFADNQIDTSLISKPCDYIFHDFGSKGSTWYYSGSLNGGYPNSSYTKFEHEKDTIILGKLTHKLKHTAHTISENFKEKPVFIKNQNDTIFWFSALDSTFKTLYIFTGKVGDTLTLDVPTEYGTVGNSDTTYSVVIDSIVPLQLEGKMTKQFYSTKLNSIGFSGPFNNLFGGQRYFFPVGAVIPEDNPSLRCFENSSTSVSFVDFECDYTAIPWATNQLSNQNLANFYPNPTSGLVKVQSEFDINNLSIFNLNGQLLKIEKGLSLDISGFPIGVYFIKIDFMDKSVGYYKVVKE